MARPPPIASDGEWEIVNEDGFIYKRRKKEGPLNMEEEKEESIGGGLDESSLKRIQLQRHKEFLLAKKARYTKELEEWEELLSSNQSTQDPIWPSETIESPRSHASIDLPLDQYQAIIDNLLLQVEQREQCIQNLTKLCTAAEAMCKRMDEELEPIHIPLTKTPRSLMHGILSSDDVDV